jgi:hypothetical protein
LKEYLLRSWDRILSPLKPTLPNLQIYVFLDFTILNSFTLKEQKAISETISVHIHMYIEIALIEIDSLTLLIKLASPQKDISKMISVHIYMYIEIALI